MIVGTQRVAVKEQHAPAMDIDHCSVVDEVCAAVSAEARTQQEVAIAVHHVARNACSGELPERAQYPTLVGIRIVVANPGFEEISEDVQRARLARLAREEIQELTGDVRARGVQVQIGNEKDGHSVMPEIAVTARSLTSALPSVR